MARAVDPEERAQLLAECRRLGGPTFKSGLAPVLLDALLAAVMLEPHLDLDAHLQHLLTRMGDQALQI